MSDFNCVVCDKSIPDYEPVYCCSDKECGCYGEPIEPPVCSDKCWKVIWEPHFELLTEPPKEQER